jgi:hypothetical protein
MQHRSPEPKCCHRPAVQNTAAQLAQQILANTNVMLKQEMVKILDFWGEKGNDTIHLQNQRESSF